MKKYCVKCGKQFESVGREVICPSCKAQAAEDAKRAAVMRTKRASWTGESVPVRISGRASTIIRAYGKVHNLPFAAALDDLLKASDFFLAADKAWEDVEPYKSHRRDKSTATSTTETEQEGKQEVTKVAKLAKPVKQASKATSKASKATSKAKIK